MNDTKRTILFIEDDPFMIDMYSHVLEKNGYDVTSATDGLEGLKQASTGKYDLILLDIMMPEMLGIEVLEKLRKDGTDLSNTKIVVLTNLAQSEDSRRALEAKADGYLIKADVTPSKLVELVGQILGE